MLDALYTTTPAHLTWYEQKHMKLNLRDFLEKQEIRFLTTGQFVVLLLIGVQ